ncbi:MAG TPA: phage tail sheath C-terminal domain-containing protein [Gaiellaceae bacterium]|nr:phage tail sheath C-terminal domain-containing protein [Gaiellaceae bacterium]
MTSSVALGAPGVYELPEPPVHALTGVRMDACAFAGVAPRGPARVRTTLPDGVTVIRRRSVAVEVGSWDDYVRLYGAFEGPGRLPWAVSAFFDQGGARAYIVRLVHEYGDDADNDTAVAHGLLGTVPLRARSEGAWGNSLEATLTFTASPLTFYAAQSTTTAVALATDSQLPAGALLRIGSALRVVTQVIDVGLGDGPETLRYATLDVPLPAAPTAADVVEGTFAVDDRDGRAETFDSLGLSPAHPRYIGDVLQDESELVEPDGAWDDVRPADASLGAIVTAGFVDGLDRYADLVPGDAFDAAWIPGDENDDLTFPAGVHCLLGNDDVAMLVVPDLYEPSPVPPDEDILSPPNLAGPTFERCADPPAQPNQAVDVPQLVNLMLDPTLPSDLETITALQSQLADLAAYSRGFVVLLDVPPGLHDRDILTWRTRFSTAFAACYHPWLLASRLDTSYASPVEVNPSAVAAGIVAQRELAVGIPFGPANEIAAEIVDVVDRVSPQRHAVLHQSNINVFLHEQDGVTLTAARTLSRDPSWRQLSVRRLVTMIERALERRMQWVVFEPNNFELRGLLTQLLRTFLRGLYQANAFTGANEAEAFFVRCDDSNNTQQTEETGQLICEIGLAPAEPLEFILVEIARAGDGTLRVGDTGG